MYVDGSRPKLLKQSVVAALTSMVWPGYLKIRFAASASRTITGPNVKFPLWLGSGWPWPAGRFVPRSKAQQIHIATRNFLDGPYRICSANAEDFWRNGVEPLDAHFPSTDDRYLLGFRTAIEKAGVHVVNIPVDNSFIITMRIRRCGQRQSKTENDGWILR